jgi:O-succinylbenzoic acid--CoA ligase
MYNIQDVNYTSETLRIKAKQMIDAAQLPTWEHSIWAFIYDFLDPQRDYFETATSGSTGAPKMITIQKKHAVASAKNTIDYFGLKPLDTVHLCMNSRYIGAKMMIIRALVCQLKLTYSEPLSNALSLIKHPVDFCAAVPLQTYSLFETQPTGNKNIKVLIIGGGVLQKRMSDLASAHTTMYYQTFGMTETISHIAVKRIYPAMSSYECVGANRIDVDTLDSSLIIHAPQLGIESLKTNDIIAFKDNKHFDWIGRKDNIINSGGIKINPEQIEALLEGVFDVPFYISSQPDDRLGQKIVLYIESTIPIDEEEIIHPLKEHLPKYHAPQQIIVEPAFSYTTTGKLIRK